MHQTRYMTFHGNDRDTFGMPVPFHVYLIVSSPLAAGKDAVASILDVNGGGLHNEVAPTEQEAIDQARTWLKGRHPDLQSVG